MSIVRRIASAASLAALTTLAACGLAADPAGGPGDVSATYQHVAYYPACGNETLTFEGVTWYPIEDPTTSKPAADALAGGGIGAPGVATAVLPGVATAALPRVVPPGEGDDVGTLTTYEGGYAYWVADSGDLDTWLTDEEQTYNWVC